MNEKERSQYEDSLFLKWHCLRDHPRMNATSQFRGSTISGINDLAHRLYQKGGLTQQERMILDKRKSFDKAVLYSYQGGLIKKYHSPTEELMENEQNEPLVRALINPNKLKQDYDDKIVSVGYEHNFKPGDIFEWIGTDTHWLIYLQDLTELAYFRGDIRKCSYEISWEDEDGKHSTYAAIRGPVETKINYIQKHGISVDTPNYSLSILMPKTDSAIKYFKRYSKFYLGGNEYSDKICWRVEAIDWISTPGILEIIAVEYYANETEDDLENGIVGGLIVEKKDPNSEEVNDIISGETFIKPKLEYIYSYDGNLKASWRVDKDTPVRLEIDGTTVKLRWVSTYSGQFDLYYGNYKKTIVVESLF